jgi:ABC-type cobalamin/Fe3+-siderophores transport system ATPase subunit
VVYSIVELNDVSFSYTGDNFINGLSLEVREGDFTALLGANGSGKSTILRLQSGILKPSQGKVLLWGRHIGSYRNMDRAKLLSYLPQVLDMNVPFRVRELVAMGLYPYRLSPELTVQEAIEMVGLSDKMEAPISTLSGGERRRAFIAMTLLQGAGMILLDEPLANLDIRYQMEIMRLLRELNSRRNISIVMALHDINLAFQFDSVVLIKEGRVLGSGPPHQVLTEDLLEEAFDIRVKTHGNEGGRFISFY